MTYSVSAVPVTRARKNSQKRGIEEGGKTRGKNPKERKYEEQPLGKPVGDRRWTICGDRQ